MKKRIALLLLAGMCLVNSVPGYASQSVKVSVADTKEAKYTTLPDSETLQKDLGFSPKTPTELSDGYLFEEGKITELYDMDEKGAVCNETKGISFSYKKIDTDPQSAQTVTLSAERASNQGFSENASTVEYQKVKLHYSDSYANSVSWIDGEVFYLLMDTDKKISEDELVAMAKGIIDMDSASSAVK